jgi:hypothetical protein
MISERNQPRASLRDADQRNGHVNPQRPISKAEPTSSKKPTGAAPASAAPGPSGLAPELPSKVLLRLRPPAGGSVKLIRLVQLEVAKFYQISVPEMLSDCKEVRVCWPRQVGMVICYEEQLGTTTVVANAFGRLDHSTLLHAIKAVRAHCLYPQVEGEVNELRTLVKARLGSFRTEVVAS